MRSGPRTSWPEYKLWVNMRQRCRAVGPFRATYFDRGIAVCERWRSFDAFFADVGERPSPAHSLDRVDDSGNYEPGNVRWATKREQALNCRRARYVFLGGERLPIAVAAQKLGLPVGRLYGRLKMGWSESELLAGTRPHWSVRLGRSRKAE